MKILFLSTWFPFPPNNGSKIRVSQMIHALQRDHEVTLVAFQPPEDRTAANVLPQPTEHLKVYPVLDDPYHFVKYLPAFKFLSPIPLAYWSHPLICQAIERLAATQTWEAVVAFEGIVSRYALQVSGLPRILDLDTALSYQMHERYMAQTQLLARLRTWISWQKALRYEIDHLKQFQVCTVVSRFEIDYLRSVVKQSGCRIELSPNGVDCEQYRPGLAQPQPDTLIFSGALTYSANYDAMHYFLNEIYPRIRQQVPASSLTITGSTAGVNLPGLRLDRTIHLAGHVSDVRPLVAGASVCVVPLRQGGGTRIKILEAMALGTPIVSTSKGAEGLDVVDGEHLLLADNPPTFAERTIQLLRDPTLRQHLITRARQLVEEKYHWESIGQHFVTLVEEAVTQYQRAKP
jgi:glycosyltransferase involved in cell wall biosynthesis